MDKLCDDMICKIIDYTPIADRWIIQSVCKTFRNVVKNNYLEETPKTTRILDCALENALSSGGLSTVRMLECKRSGAWRDALKNAASYGDLSVVHFLLGMDWKLIQAIEAFSISLYRGHIGVCDALWDRFDSLRNALPFWMMSSAVGKLESITWLFSKHPIDAAKMLNKYPLALFTEACIKSDIRSVSFLYGQIEEDIRYVKLDRVISDKFFSTNFYFSTNANFEYDYFFLSFSNSDVWDFVLDIVVRQNYDHKTKKEVVINLSNKNYFLENNYDYVEKFFPGLLKDDEIFRNFEIRANSIWKQNANKKTIRSLKTLIEAFSDAKYWTTNITHRTLKSILESETVQRHVDFLPFFKNVLRFTENFRFDINDVISLDALKTLMEMGGRCWALTFYRAASDSTDSIY